MKVVMVSLSRAGREVVAKWRATAPARTVWDSFMSGYTGVRAGASEESSTKRDERRFGRLAGVVRGGGVGEWPRWGRERRKRGAGGSSARSGDGWTEGKSSCIIRYEKSASVGKVVKSSWFRNSFIRIYRYYEMKRHERRTFPTFVPSHSPAAPLAFDLLGSPPPVAGAMATALAAALSSTFFLFALLSPL